MSKSLLLPIHGVLAVMGNVRHPCRTRVSKVYFTYMLSLGFYVIAIWVISYTRHLRAWIRISEMFRDHNQALQIRLRQAAGVLHFHLNVVKLLD